MRDLNIDFMDLYKRVDRFIKDAYCSSDGVSEYLRLMESKNYKGSRYVAGWNSDYDSLKHSRWIRNQLAHEVDYDSDICSNEEYEWLEEFYTRLFSSDDPLGKLHKAEIAMKLEQKKKREIANRQKKVEASNEHSEADCTDSGNTNIQRENNFNYNLPPTKRGGHSGIIVFIILVILLLFCLYQLK